MAERLRRRRGARRARTSRVRACAKAEVQARRFEQARALLIGAPWLSDYADGEALAVLAQAEYGLGRYADAAAHFELARSRAPASRVPILAVRAGLAYEGAGQP